MPTGELGDAVADLMRHHPSMEENVDTELWVICLCAQWCHLCRDLLPGFAALNTSRPGIHWRWIDIEDDEPLVGDVEIDTFPTYLIADRSGVLLFAPGPIKAEALPSFVHPYLGGGRPVQTHDPAIRQIARAVQARDLPLDL